VNDDLLKLLRRLGRCQAQINAELAKGAKADQDKIAAAFAAGKGLRPGCRAILPSRLVSRRDGWRRRQRVATPFRDRDDRFLT